MMQDIMYKRLTNSTGSPKNSVNPLYSNEAKNCSIKNNETKYSAKVENKQDMP